MATKAKVDYDYEDLEFPGRIVEVIAIRDGEVDYVEMDGPSLDEFSPDGEDTHFYMAVSDFESGFTEVSSCTACNGTGGQDGHDCETCDGTGFFPGKSSARVAAVGAPKTAEGDAGEWESLAPVGVGATYAREGANAMATVEPEGEHWCWYINAGDDWDTIDDGEADSESQAKRAAQAAFDGLYSRGKF